MSTTRSMGRTLQWLLLRRVLVQLLVPVRLRLVLPSHNST